MSDTGTPEVEPPAPAVDGEELPEVLGLREAARLVGMPLTSFRRRLPELESEGATKRPDGQGWAIPLEALHKLRMFDQVRGEYGGRPDRSAHSASSGNGPARRAGPGADGTAGTLPPGALDAEQAAALRAELAATREREVAARERAAAAEATANERGRTLQMLEAGYVRQLESSQETIRLLESKMPTPEPPRRRGWFGRGTTPGDSE